MGLALAALAIGTLYSQKRLDVVGGILLLGQTLPIAVRRHDPLRILYFTGTSIIAYSLLGYPESNGYFGVFVAFYTVAANEPRRIATIAAAITAGGIGVSFAGYAIFANMQGQWLQNLWATYLAYGLAWVIGDNLRVRRAYTRELEERAIQLEREREEQAALAVSQERARIARELHDVVAHHVSVMVVQAAAARRVAATDPAASLEAIGAVETAGRTALNEMRRMLEVLRTDEAGVGPQPGLGDLDRLVEQVRETGLPVSLVIEGAPRQLPVGMDLAAYRIVQEALTNTVKHAGKANAHVTIRYLARELEIEVVDDGRGAAAPLIASKVDGAGQGLVGMRERVALYGGEIQTGPVFPGGYRVHVRLPFEPPEPGSVAECCDEETALSAVATVALRERLNRGSYAEAEQALVKPRVVPPLIGRVVPPHPAPAGEAQGKGKRRPQPPRQSKTES